MIHHYHINLFWLSEEMAWVADVPDLRPCTVFGTTPSEALAEAEVLVPAWIKTARDQGLVVPDPRYRPAIYAAPRAA